MYIHSDPFSRIKSEKKKLEVRLNYRNRDRIKTGDTILLLKRPDFKDKIKVKVIGVSVYKDFVSLVNDNKLSDFGSKIKSKRDIIKKGIKFYSEEKQRKYGFIVFRIKLI